jgi:hypothetical protein
MKNNKKIVNHVIYALDVSGSMDYIIGHAKNVLQAGLDAMKAISIGSGQETLVSVYTFNHEVNALFTDRPIQDVSLNNINFTANGGTALIDAAMKTILDGLTVQVNNKKTESHAYLLNIITDGDERHSNNSVNDLRNIIAKLNDEWTLAIQVPNQQGVHLAKLYGFPAGNINVWKAGTKEGLEESFREYTKGFTNYTQTRSAGGSSLSNYYTPDISNVSKGQAKSVLSEVNGRLYHCQSGPVEIRDFVERAAATTYKSGKAYYELTKPELVQEHKNIVIVNKKDGRKYGGSNARSLIGLPSDKRVKVAPGTHGDWRVFVQSTSVNRKIYQGTSVFVED